MRRWPRVVAALSAALAITLVGGCSSRRSSQALRSPETLRLDDAGTSLDAHDGQISMDQGRAVLIGTSYDCGFRYNDLAAAFCGFHSYTSSDLVHWHDAGLLFDAAPAYWQQLCAHGAFGCYRPHEIYLTASRHWVLWVNVPGGYRVLTSAHATGPFTGATTPRLPADVGGLVAGNYGDEALAVDPKTGRGYLAYTAIALPGNAHDIEFQELDAAGTGVEGPVTRLGQTLVEAPSLYQLDGSWWVTYSDPACPYCSGTGTSLAQAPGPLGPWHTVGSLTKTSCWGQPAAVNILTINGHRQIIYQSDLWDNGNSNEARARTYLAPIVPLSNGRLPQLLCEAADPP